MESKTPAHVSDADFNKQMVELIGKLVYNNGIRVERKSAYNDFSELHIYLGSGGALDMFTLRRLVELGFELRSVTNDFEVKHGYEDTTSVEGNTVLVYIRSNSNVKPKP